VPQKLIVERGSAHLKQSKVDSKRGEERERTGPDNWEDGAGARDEKGQKFGLKPLGQGGKRYGRRGEQGMGYGDKNTGRKETSAQGKTTWKSRTGVTRIVRKRVVREDTRQITENLKNWELRGGDRTMDKLQGGRDPSLPGLQGEKKGSRGGGVLRLGGRTSWGKAARLGKKLLIKD